MKTKEKILAILMDNRDYVSGQEICDRLGLSRTAVWKHIQSLKEDGYEIDSVNNRGYKLLAEPDSINASQISQYLNTKWLGKTIIYEPVMDSTNIQAKRLGENDGVSGTVVVTEKQTAGRGRRGKSWVSPEGNCYFSMLLRPDVRMDRAPVITLIAAMAMAKAIRETVKLDTQIKWPNDVIADGKKLCGILTESSTDLEYIHYVVVGIGVNCNQVEFPEELRNMAASICQLTGQKVNRARLLAVFFDCFEEYYDIFLQTEDLSRLSDEYNGLLINRGKEVKLVEKNGERILTAIGVDDMGGLIVENSDGNRETIISGEVSVRGLYGYV